MEWIHKEVTITVDEKGQFHPQGAEEGTYRHFGYDGLSQARQAVDTQLDIDVKERTANISFSVMDDSGQIQTCRGVNRNSGTMLGVKAPKGSRDVYFPHLKVKALLEEQRRLQARMHEIAETLRPVSMPISRGFGNVTLEKYDRVIGDLLRQYQNAERAVAELAA